MSLLEQVQGLIERTYDLPSSPIPIARFVVGDDGYRRLYGGREERAVGSAGGGARTLVREDEVGPRASIYYPDELIRTLEQHPPWRGVHRDNVDAFATLVEELDHLLLLQERERQGRGVSLLELELQANVTKFLVLSRFLAGSRGQLDDARRLWLRRRLFSDVRFVERDATVRERYERAARWAVRFLDAVRQAPPAHRIPRLRRFHDADLSGKREMIAAA